MRERERESERAIIRIIESKKHVLVKGIFGKWQTCCYSTTGSDASHANYVFDLRKQRKMGRRNTYKAALQ